MQVLICMKFYILKQKWVAFKPIAMRDARRLIVHDLWEISFYSHFCCRRSLLSAPIWKIQGRRVQILQVFISGTVISVPDFYGVTPRLLTRFWRLHIQAPHILWMKVVLLSNTAYNGNFIITLAIPQTSKIGRYEFIANGKNLSANAQFQLSIVNFHWPVTPVDI